jgi:hypothetical protein
MKTDHPEQGSIYRGKDEKPKFRPDVHLPLLLAALLVVHFLNLFMHWTVIRGELAALPSYRTPEYTFLGFSPLNPEEVAAAQRLPNASPSGRVFAFFDWLHPAVFLVWNNGAGEDFFDLGPLLAAVPAGASRVSLLPAGIFLLRQGDKVVAKNYGGSILGAVWARSWSKKDSIGNSGNGDVPGSFVVKPAQGSSSLKVPFLAYFYLPLVVIVILIATSGTAMAAAFSYYAGMFFLFDFQALFVTVPLAWLFNALGVELSDPWVKVLAAALALCFLAASLYGLWSWRNRQMPAGSKWIVWFFILLPLFLFF